MPKYRVRVASPTINVWEVEADDSFEAEEKAWMGSGTLIDSYPDWNLDEVLDSEEIN
jgi:hypothetical protein